jgi:SAM-dependent methyltransferase
MIRVCSVCKNENLKIVYQSSDNLSVTTMNKLIPGKTTVCFCENCGHLQTDELDDLKTFYAEEYEINLNSEDDDQLYAIVNNLPVYRSEHQANVLMQKVNLSNGAKVLDYGCAKSQTLKRVLSKKSNIEPFFFDVTDKYISFWKSFAPQAEWSTHTPNFAWNGTMDVVLSFYALEHVADLHDALDNIKNMLKVGGDFYFLVPNVYKNTADFIVADHVNHFSKVSLYHLLSQHGFSNIDIDEEVHESAFVVKATLTALNDKKNTILSKDQIQQIPKLKDSAIGMSGYWTDVIDRIQLFEMDVAEDKLAVYGAGFYGNFIATAMKDPKKITCFIDQNKHLTNTEINGKPVLDPENIPKDVKHVLVGMNPELAKENIDQIEALKALNLNYFFL